MNSSYYLAQSNIEYAFSSGSDGSTSVGEDNTDARIRFTPEQIKTHIQNWIDNRGNVQHIKGLSKLKELAGKKKIIQWTTDFPRSASSSRSLEKTFVVSVYITIDEVSNWSRT